MNANELVVYLEDITDSETSPYRQAATMLRNQQALIENLNGRIERMIEKQSHYESMEHAAGFEAGRELGMKQERALWQLAASTQEIENERK
jgi:predicted Zn-dependent protease